MKAVLRDVSASKGEIILFIDELHTLVGAGAAEGAVDASNLLKPQLARGELHCVGATTLKEYRKVISFYKLMYKYLIFRIWMKFEIWFQHSVWMRFEFR